MKMPLHKFGEWSRAGIVLRRMSVTLNNKMKERIRNDADDLLQKLQTYIETGMVKPPDAPTTLAKKYPEDRPWIESYTLLDSMKVKVKESDARRGRQSIFIGVDKGVREPRTGVDVNQLAQWLEFGTDKMPPRPVFHPVMEDNKDRLKKEWKRLVGETIAILGDSIPLDVK